MLTLYYTDKMKLTFRFGACNIESIEPTFNADCAVVFRSCLQVGHLNNDVTNDVIEELHSKNAVPEVVQVCREVTKR